MDVLWVVLALLGVGVLVATFVADAVEIDLPLTDVGLPAEALGGFLAATGGIGWLMTSSGAAPVLSVPVALGAGVGAGAAAIAMVRFLVTSPTDPTPTRDDFVGAIARVITPIAPGGVGEVLLTRHGQPWKVAAELADVELDPDADPVPAGTQVVVVQARSATRLVVTPADL